MKILGIVGSNAEQSYNRMLLQFINRHFDSLFDMEIVEIKDIPLFNQSIDQTSEAPIQNLAQKISNADGIIIATPEHNHTIPAALKSMIEWMSFKIHPFTKKPVMIVGASYYDQGSSRAQLHLRQILNAPGVNAFVLPGNEFLLGNVKTAFDAKGDIQDQKTVEFLQNCLEKFLRFIQVISLLNDSSSDEKAELENLFATNKVDTTIEGVDMYAEDWVEQASAKVNAVEGDTYIKLDAGVLTVNQLNYLLKSLPMEITFADDNNQFIYYNHAKESDEMLAKRKLGQVGNPLAACHPEKVHANVSKLIHSLRTGEKSLVRTYIPSSEEQEFIVHNYQAMRNDNGEYKGLNEYIVDYQPIIDYYLAQTGQLLIKNPNVDTVSGASQSNKEQKPIQTDSIKNKATVVAVDEVSGASKHTNNDKSSNVEISVDDTKVPSVEAVSGASQSNK